MAGIAASSPTLTTAPSAQQQGFVRRHPVVAYFCLTSAISWGSVLWIVGGPGRIPGTPEEIVALFPAVYLATVAGPSLAGIAMTGLVAGSAGLRELVARLVRWRVGAGWYAVALLTAPLSVVVTLLALSLASPTFLPGFLTTGGKAFGPGGLITGADFGLVVGLGLATGFLEELGWTGFAIPRLRPRHGVFAIGVLVGFLWGAWHFLSNLAGSDISPGAPPLALSLPVLLFSFLPPYRVLMVWVYDRTGSLLVSVLMHASLVTFWLVATPPGIAGVPLMIWYVAWAAALWGAVAAVRVANRRSPSSPQDSRALEPAGA